MTNQHPWRTRKYECGACESCWESKPADVVVPGRCRYCGAPGIRRTKRAAPLVNGPERTRKAERERARARG